MQLQRELDRLGGKHKAIKDELAIAMTLATEVAVALEEQGEGEKNLDEAMQSYITMEKLLQDHATIIGEVRNVLRNEEGETNLVELIDRRHAEAAEEDAQFQRHPRYREFRQKVWKVHHPDEALPDEANDDLVVMATQDENNLMCPITRKLLVEPVKNKEAILAHMKANKRKGTKCPVAGCAADVTQLEEDREVSYRVEREAKRANSSKRKRKARNDDYTQV
ncbi:E3 SUMOprotein ligase NSE2, putative [Acanthamoeba castellanii str. Neff]|uniref:E3 SUMOprotein ligase NSE2, putative n=1 Tax=Acanthamoeba castellanii (strain ATCC 30010 / Neff) TaxID=1257118 RepID=L8HGT6_ACACF|nr:E3 SUMOprotein ligase NSE2, putative [Acanthamoeba castellanii str. Neff]ELR23923.1 E3 SUMOprotein ligase NSE2, putative [Acanthamoeba castellanii str. Neff]